MRALVVLFALCCIATVVSCARTPAATAQQTLAVALMAEHPTAAGIAGPAAPFLLPASSASANKDDIQLGNDPCTGQAASSARRQMLQARRKLPKGGRPPKRRPVRPGKP